MLKWNPIIKITIPQTGEVIELKNMITTLGLNTLIATLRGESAEINYVAWGNGNTAPALSDVALDNETGRKQITKAEAGDDGENITTCYLAPYEANGQIEEIGWFVGGTAVTDSGTLIARVLYSHEKTDSESILIERTDAIEEVI